MNKSGTGLAGIVIVLLLLTVLGVGIASLISIELSAGTGDRDSRRAMCLAESGIEYALWRLDQDAGWIPDPASEYSLGAGTFTLELIENSDDTNTLVSTGYVPDKTDAEAVRGVNITGELLPPGSHPLYQYAFWMDTGSWLNYRRRSLTTIRQPPLYADFYANGDLVFLFGSGQQVQGTVSTTSSASAWFWSGGDPWILVEEGAPFISAPVLDSAAESWYENVAYVVYTGDQTFENVEIPLGAGRVYLIKGDLTIGNVVIRGKGTGVATGNVTITGTISYDMVGGNLQGPLGLVAFGDILCDQDIDPLQASMYAGDQFRTSGGCTIEVFGSIGSKNGLEWVNGTDINISYDNRLADGSPADNSLPAAASRVYCWKEVYR